MPFWKGVKKQKLVLSKRLISTLITIVILISFNVVPANAVVVTNGKYNCNTGSLDDTLSVNYFTIASDAVTGNTACVGDVIIPNGVISIDYEAFYEARNITSVIIPNSVLIIDDYAFESSSVLRSVTIGNSVTSIGRCAFCGTDLRSVTIPNSVLTIGDDAFSSTALTSVIIPDSVISIGEDSFRDNTALTSVTIGNSVSTIGLSAFQDSGLTSVTIGNSVATIGDYAFRRTNLISVTIPNSVRTIGNFAFTGDYFGSFTFLGNAPASVNDAAFPVTDPPLTANVAYNATGFPANGLPWKGLTVSYDTPPADDDNPPSGGGSDSSTSTPSLSTSTVATKSVDASLKLTNRKYLSKFEIRKAITKGRSFKRKPIDIYKYSISKTSKKNCVMSGNYVMRLKENAVCEITVTRSTKNGIKSKYQVKINYNN